MDLKIYLPVSIIIPYADRPLNLQRLLSAINASSCLPSQILIVDSCRQLRDNLSLAHSVISQFPGIANKIEILMDSTRLMPGEARNLALREISCDWIAFLDHNTIPQPDWLFVAYSFAIDNNLKFLQGSTQYVAASSQQLLFIYATYGCKPLPTLPGSLIHQEVFHEIGRFLPNIRAGEDTDWLVRARQFGYFSNHGKSPALIYDKLPKNLCLLARKWFRNYRSCASVVFHLEFQKTFYFLVFNIAALIAAFRWNAIVAGWQESNIFYFANISKIASLLLVVFYLIVRGFCLPFRKGASFRTLLPFYWIPVALVSVVLDIAKLLAFVLPPWRVRARLMPK